MYRLWSDPGSKYPRDLVANVSEQPPYSSWSLGKDNWKDVHVDGPTGGGRLYHGGLSFNPLPNEATGGPIHVAVKWMHGQRAISKLRHEAEMYTGPLKHLQGKAVPIFYGFFTGNVDGIDVGCIVLEWCPHNDWMTFGKPEEDEL
ncbi:hypothetical protein C8Q79DRAFT_1005511 [Trametes meyenii]|nr:hypothetical protein C8Q79DRAFT_1005511 [Trametes meyenii]